MPKHRLSRKNRYIALAATGAVVVAGAGVAAQTSTAAPAWPAQKTYTGRAFDTCTAPSLTAMNAWKKNGYYGGVAVYVGGKNRGCAQPNLTRSWVKSVDAMGWRVIPLYVGAQPPCQKSRNKERFTAATAVSVGASNAGDAVAKASALGMKPGSPIYLNMESYDITDKACNDATLAYVRSFTKTLRAKTYRAGLYGFSSSSAAAIATAKDRTDLPGNLWYALWNGRETTTKDWPWDPRLYTGHSRGHQYKANSRETRRGHTLTVDLNAWDAPVALAG
ncbi:glycoside hydrolase domain-containing protein [Streptomyces fradiae]|uniref:glycoside hydrolase domain-containing protein n=1 Tax=Streptomyces fradiae TaxID=1906 RepID=UPI0034038405